MTEARVFGDVCWLRVLCVRILACPQFADGSLTEVNASRTEALASNRISMHSAMIQGSMNDFFFCSRRRQVAAARETEGGRHGTMKRRETSKFFPRRFPARRRDRVSVGALSSRMGCSGPCNCYAGLWRFVVAAQAAGVCVQSISWLNSGAIDVKRELLTRKS